MLTSEGVLDAGLGARGVSHGRERRKGKVEASGGLRRPFNVSEASQGGAAPRHEGGEKKRNSKSDCIVAR